ncbi:MAG: bifunctional (p)ppGpp synthetase/guanosine-3',5'-bis(diphosphate) 3'-pyrophosphohydrolase [Defluviitaleaceae bacterium]|nr:bifunctional (p)ppGpp synthetase/guanosine-3',5'-bis(diphosphate) 3'-pyrophosphohydrolase [Defluviitaleaceae bacterium]
MYKANGDEGDRIFKALIKKMQTYRPSSDFTMVARAYKLAKDAHEGQLRRSGEPYIIHPLEVAAILAELEVDRETITAGILHDVVEDTHYTQEDLVEMFGSEVASLVDGVTKLKVIRRERRKEKSQSEEEAKKVKTRGDDRDRAEEQANNYRKMFLAMADDIRVVLIKLADRVHNLRTLSAMPPENQRRIAKESLEIYAPLAGRLGVTSLRREMEDLAFKYYDPENFQMVKDKVGMKLNKRTEYMEDIVGTLRMRLHEDGIFGQVKGRPKHFFSIYKKMNNKEKDLDEILDLFAVRVIVKSKEDCWRVLGIVNGAYTPMPDTFKDYISNPKGNGYQSIHNVLWGPDSEPFEVQIRTEDMHKEAERGVAAHWKYKEGATGQDSGDEKLAWLAGILELQRENPDNDEFLPLLKESLNIHAEWVYCYTPQQQMKPLPAGATCIDFAYAVHSAVGNKMTGAKVNGKMVKIGTVLRNGDLVEIETSPNAKGPTDEWLKMAKTTQAKTKIRQWQRQEDKEISLTKGKELLERAAKRKGFTFAALHTPQGERLALSRFSMNDFDTLCAAVGRGTISEISVINRLHEVYQELNPETVDTKEILEAINKNTRGQEYRHTRGAIVIQGDSGLATHFSKCCNPIPGDDIIGYVTKGRGIAVHRVGCATIRNISEENKRRLIEVEWNKQTLESNRFTATMKIYCDSMKYLQQIVDVFSKMEIDIKAINGGYSGGDVVCTVALEVDNRETLEKASNRLLSLKGVNEIDRKLN